MLPGPRGAQRVQPNVILAVLSLAALTYSILSSAVIPALPTIQHSLQASETGITWLLTGFLLSASVGTAIIGKLGDMYGKQRLLVWTLLILAAGTLLAALADTLPVLIVARVIQGVAGGIFPLAFAIVRDEFPADRVAGSIGLMSAILGVGEPFCGSSVTVRDTTPPTLWRSTNPESSRPVPAQPAAIITGVGRTSPAPRSTESVRFTPATSAPPGVLRGAWAASSAHRRATDPRARAPD